MSRVKRAVLVVALIASVLLTVYGTSVMVAFAEPDPEVETKVVQDPDSGKYHATFRVEAENGSRGYWLSAGTYPTEDAAEDAVQDVRDRMDDPPGTVERAAAGLTPFSAASAVIIYFSLTRSEESDE